VSSIRFAVVCIFALSLLLIPLISLAQKSNIILISIDSLRKDHLSFFGYARETSPFWTHQARTGGLLFNYYYSSSFLTPIAEATVHTGLMPEQNGMISFRHPILPSVKTLAEVLKDRGYKTLAVGNSPEFKIWPALKQSFSRGFDTYLIQDRFAKDNRTLNLQDLSAEIRNIKLNKFLDKQAPFFIWLAIGDVHSPFGYKLANHFAESSYLGIFSELIFLGNFQHYYDGKVFPITKETRFKSSPTLKIDPIKPYGFTTSFSIKTTSTAAQKDLNHLNDLYDNGIYAADKTLEGIYSMLEQHGLLKNSIIIIQSEHGESLGENGIIAHYDITHEVINTPLWIQTPKTLTAKTIDSPVSGADLYKFILQAADDPQSQQPHNIEKLFSARDLVYISRTPLWESILNIDSTNLYEQFRTEDQQNTSADYAIIKGKYKLIHRRARFIEEKYSCWKFISGRYPTRDEYELYFLDLTMHKEQKVDLTSKTNAQIYRELKAHLFEFESKALTAKKKLAPIKEMQDYK
jgi:arylsulfatase A-like enzyme